jgi:hypothetical protein
MELQVILPSKPGQICRLLHPEADEKPEEVYILAEDPKPFGPNDRIYVVGLKELQRNAGHPGLAERIAVEKSGLSVVADDLEAYIRSWNEVV